MSDFSSTTVPLWVTLCGKAAPVASIVVFMAPIPTIRRVVDEKSVGNLPLLPYTSMICSTFVWVLYGVLKSEAKVWSANGVGLILGAYYFLEFIRICPKKSATLPGSVWQHMQAISAFVIASSAIAAFFGPRWVGNLGVALCVGMFASPLAALKVVLQTKSSEAIPLPFTLSAVINCFLWSATGILDMRDHNIYVPNILGLGLGLIQLALKIIFPDTETNELPH